MLCIHCGHCCTAMSPVTNGEEPCPHLSRHPDYDGDIVLCEIYENRPPRCREFDFQASICPIGMDKLRFYCADQAHTRANRVWTRIYPDAKEV